MAGRLPTSALWSLLAGVVGCAGSDTPGSAGVSVRDSAGIRIVEHASLDSSTAAISIGSEPVYRVGWPPDELILERVSDVAVFANGRVLVADGGTTQELLVLDRSGDVERVLGGRGEGPGEFAFLSLARAGAGDTILAQEERTGRVTIFDGDDVVTRFSTGGVDNVTILGHAGGKVFLGPPFGLVMGRLYPERWRRVPLVTVTVPSLETDTVGEVAWDQSLDFNGRDPFAGHGFAVASGEAFVVGRGDRPELRWYGKDGALLRVSRWQDGPKPAPEAALDEWEARFRSSFEEMPRGRVDEWVERTLDQHVGTVPYFSDLLTDPEGRIFIGEFVSEVYAPPGPPGRRFFVFSPSGESIGIARMPTESGFELLAVGTDRVVGVQRNAFDVEAVVAYPVVR